MTTLAEVQQLWHNRWAPEPQPERPSCYNHKPFVETVTSDEFPDVVYPFRMSRYCGHWHAGGNAHIRAWCDSAGGRRTSWTACSGCNWKGEQ